jgi:LAS superfamily LD-carboxypeptidase LdcB
MMVMLVGTAAFSGPGQAAQARPTAKAHKLKTATARPKIKQVQAPQQPENLPPALTEKTENINPELLARFDAFRTYVYQKHGVVLEIKSGYRSPEEQAYLYRTLPRGMANPPGKSNHEKGLAIDYSNYSPTYNQYLPMFGLKAPFAGHEDWHIEMVETQD